MAGKRLGGKRKKRRQSWRQSRGQNREFIFTGLFFTLLFFCMMAYYSYFVGENGREMINNSYNSRQYLLAAQNVRGTIYSADEETLAETITGEDGTELRSYPYGELFSHAVGFSTRGKTGIEAQANSWLIQSGIPLALKAENAAEGKKNPGDNVYTSLRTDLQEVASKSLGVSQGAIIVSNVKTGEILAMVSKPDFHPGTIAEDWEEYTADEDSSVLVNRVAQGIYPPGSTFKIVTALAWLRQNGGGDGGFSFTCSGSYTVEGSRITCYHGTVHGRLDLAGAFSQSCNCAFAAMGLEIDQEAYQGVLDDLGFNEALPVDFNYNKSSLTVDGSVSDAGMVQIAFGQGSAQMTPLHLHLITNAIASGGIPMKPYLLTRVETAQGEVVESFSAESYKALMSQEEADALKELMTAVVEEGTASKLKGLSYTAAGKTGSAEYNQVKEDSHAWFTGFAPVKDPEVSVTIIVEKIGSGGDYAVPIAKRLFDAYFGVE